VRPLHDSTTLGAYLDGELVAPDLKAFEDHLAACAVCAGNLGAMRQLRVRLHGEARYYRPQLEASARLRMIAAAARPVTPRPNALPLLGAREFWIPAIAAAAACLLLIWDLALWPHARSDSSRLADEIVADHLRSLTASHLTDLASSDARRVRPWFAERLDAAPLVADFSEAGFTLLGGRLDRLDGRAVAALVYRHQGHVINVFALPEGKQDSDPVPRTRRGYALARWACEGLTYWAISDTNDAAVEALGRLVIRTADSDEPR
jgi:anti-sigma factor RsiW